MSLTKFGIHESLSCAHTVGVGALCSPECYCQCHEYIWPMLDFLSKLLDVDITMPPAKGFRPPLGRRRK